MLHHLYEYAQREGIVLPPGLQRKTIKWLLVFSPEGQFIDALDMSGGQKRSKGREFAKVPQAPANWLQGGGRCHFLVESLATILNWCDDAESQSKIAAKHQFFVDLFKQAATATPSQNAVPEFLPLAKALENETVLEQMRNHLASKKASPTDIATLAFASSPGAPPRIFVEETSWHAWWMDFLQTIRESDSSRARRGRPSTRAQLMCDFLTGDLVVPVRTQPKVRGLADVGGLATGDVLAGYDKDAFTSFGLEQSANAAMSEENANIYVTAFNHLIGKRGYRLASPKQGSGVKVVYWYNGSVPEELDPALDVLGDLAGIPMPTPTNGAETSEASSFHIDQAETRAAKALRAIHSGTRPELGNLQYYAITLSGNSGRVVVRDWMEGNFRELVENINSWFDDLSIVSLRDGSVISSFKFVEILSAPVRELGDVTAPLAAALWRCALKRQPIPYEVAAQTLKRVQVDIINEDNLRPSRFGLLKAFTIRNERVPSMSEALNEYETHPAYLCGRIMALLGAIQREALGDVGAGVIQRYYAAASATPALVLGRLIRTAQIAHLPKIQQEGLRHWFDNQLAELWSKMKGTPPRTLTLEEQTLFAMGYYHQLAERFKKANKVEEKEAAADEQPELPLG